MLGSVLILVLQVNFVWLSALTSAMTVGIVTAAKIVPQWGVNLVLDPKPDLTPTSALGAGLVMLASVAYAALRAGRRRARAPELPKAEGLVAPGPEA